ncbi:MAG: hypothetical protein WEB60_09480, partial [Terrimicrobiaceae bacterium]
GCFQLADGDRRAPTTDPHSNDLLPGPLKNFLVFKKGFFQRSPDFQSAGLLQIRHNWEAEKWKAESGKVKSEGIFLTKLTKLIEFWESSCVKLRLINWTWAGS